MRRRFLCLLTALTLLTGCTAPGSTSPNTDPQPVNLIYYTIGEPDADLELVNQALNDILLPRYGFTVTYKKIGWNDYTAQLNSHLGTGQTFDIAFVWTESYVTGATSGAWLDLTDRLGELEDIIDQGFWRGVTVDGRIWGIPTNKELACPVHYLFSQDLVDKYGIDIAKYRSFVSLEPLLQLIKASEPDYIPLFLDSNPTDILTLDGYEYVGFDSVPLMVYWQDPQCQVVNFFETESGRSLLRTLRRYYELGYINQDACLRTGFSRYQDEQVFIRLSVGGPDAEASYSTDYGYPIVAQQASPSVVTTDSTQGGIMVASANTQHPQECMTFLTAVNTDPEVRNLLNYGIEGVHYTLTAEDQVKIISPDYRGVPYTQGNWFILKTTVGESLNKWDLYRAFNENTVESPLLGFTPDYSQNTEVFNAVVRVCEKYYGPLLTGTVDPDVYLPRFLEELEQAGIGQLQATLQHQIDTWRAAQD